MMNLPISVVRNTWAIMGFGIVYLLLIWGVFLVVNHQEIAIAELTRSPQSLDNNTVMKLYDSFKRGDPRVHEKVTLMRLSEALIHRKHLQPAREVSQQVLKMDPLDHQWRLQLALAFHNAGMYKEAERHFSTLLKEQNHD